jgi:hypothetical protein
MKSGRKRFEKRIGIFLNIEKSTRNLARHLKLSDTEAYTKGVMDFAMEHSEKLTEQHINMIIQNERAKMKKIQDEIAHMERVALDLHIRDEVRKKKSVETRLDDRGQEYLVVALQ